MGDHIGLSLREQLVMVAARAMNDYPMAAKWVIEHLPEGYEPLNQQGEPSTHSKVTWCKWYKEKFDVSLRVASAEYDRRFRSNKENE